jgi:outer membrane receptor protein involved in Fe transport
MATSFGGNSRSLDLREMPMNNVSRVEVTKVPTPDMSASGLGGSINLISRNGFEVKKRRILFNAYTQFHNRNGLTFDGGPRNHVSANSPDLHPAVVRLQLPAAHQPQSRHHRRRRAHLALQADGDRHQTTDESPAWDLVRLVQTTSQWNSLAQTFRTLQGSDRRRLAHQRRPTRFPRP